MPSGCALQGVSNPGKGLLRRAVSRAQGFAPFRVICKRMYCLAYDLGIFSIPAFSGALIGSASADLWNKDSFSVKSLAVKLEMKESWRRAVGGSKLVLPEWKCSYTTILYDL